MDKAAQKFPKSVGNIGRQKHYWGRVRDILDGAVENPIEANRKLRLLTGHDLPEVVNSLRDMIANYGKAIGK